MLIDIRAHDVYVKSINLARPLSQPTKIVDETGARASWGVIENERESISRDTGPIVIITST
jgi:hypothetical protein